MITSNIQPMSNAMLPRNVIIESANLLTGKSTATDPQKNPIDGRKNSVADVYTRTSDEQQASADLQASKIQRLLEVSRADYVTLEGSEDDEVASGSSEKRAIVSDESGSNATKDHKLTKYGYDYVAKLIRESEATKGSSPINMLRSICYEKKYSDFYAMRHYSNSTE